MHVQSSIILSSKKVETPKGPLTDELINKMYVYVYTMECYSALEMKEILTCGTTQMNLEEIKWNKPVTKDKHSMILLI